MLENEYDSLSDEAIIERIQEELKASKSRDPILDANEKVNELFEALYARYRRSIHSYIARYVFDADAVDDVFQDVIIKVYTHIHRFVLKTSFKAWIYKIAMNTSLNYLKRHKRHAKLSLNAPTTLLDGETRDMIDLLEGREEAIDAALIRKDTIETLNAIVETLPKELREVFILKKNERFTYDEIAEILGYSSRHVKTRMSKALLIIADELRKRNISKDLLDF